MDNQSAPAEPKDARVQAALREYLERVDRGEAIDREKFIAQPPRSPKNSGRSSTRKTNSGGWPEPSGPTSGSTRPRSRSLCTARRRSRREAGRSRSAESDAGGLKQEFGRYRIVKALGKGAMGMVYLAEDTQLQRQVALKTPHFEQEPTAELLERFYREARAAATLRHPNICPVYDVGQIEGTHYISMAYIEGHPLSAFIRSASRSRSGRS